MRYLPLQPADRQAMLGVIGASSVDDLFVDVPAVGRKVAKGESIAVVESVKAASDIY